jgi:F-type H+-transporting ATPase subunit b
MNTLVNSFTVVAEEDNPLLSLSPGLMIWTMIMFLLTNYKVQLADARKEADELRDRGRREGERERASIVTAAEGQRERIMADTKQQVDAQSQAALQSVRGDVASIALAAAEKVTRKSLNDADHRRLVEEALQEIELSNGMGIVPA